MDGLKEMSVNHKFIRDVVVSKCEINEELQPFQKVSFYLYYQETKSLHNFPEVSREFYEDGQTDTGAFEEKKE